MTLPVKYSWLNRVNPPKLVVQALREFGTIEAAGAANNSKIIGWAGETGLKNVYTADSVPWCGLFMAVVAKRAGYSRPANPLWALNWANFGTSVGQPGLGDVLTFTRSTGGHVGLYIGEDKTTYHVLGGNQQNMVNITRVDKKRLYRARRPRFLIGKPASVRPYILDAGGIISDNEA